MRYGLIGEKLSHSRSPEIHGHFGNDSYALWEIPPEDLDGFMRRRDFDGINVTIPYKKAVIPYCAALSRDAARMGSVNTIIRDKDGNLYGHNTDCAGLAHMAARAGIGMSGKKTLILGSGGTALTAQAAAEDAGASEIVLVSRSGAVNYRNVYDIKDAEIIINATPVGMFPHNGEAPIDLRRFPSLFGVLDVVYNPLDTELVLTARDMGIPCTGGLPMLVEQARRAAELFFRRDIPERDAESVLRKVGEGMMNIVLIGMPGSGKSAVGDILSQKTGRSMADIDKLIEERANMSIPDIFSKYGEDHFRNIERDVIAQTGKQGGMVIATGGGAVLDRRNLNPLRQNGRIYYLDRALDSLPREGRPLSLAGNLAKMYEVRAPLYEAFAHSRISNNTTPEEAARLILEDFYEAANN